MHDIYVYTYLNQPTRKKELPSIKKAMLKNVKLKCNVLWPDHLYKF